MQTPELLLIALGLSMDAFAVAVASGATMKRLHLPNALKMGLFFGGFQALMPVLGWLAGLSLKGFISGVDHWIAFGLLSAIGGKMLYEAFKIKEEEECGGTKTCPFDTGTLTVLAIATSIDALAVGVTFAALAVSIVTPVLVIGAVTFAMSVAGVRLGSSGGHFFEHKMEAAGGLILIAIGLKILAGHLGLL
ncbi:MAG: manganese efflux pump MntP family protein [Elusimicrobiales bacterium]|nr:manganese efflux pump MntP family protein [Elusimicrobiales bacterium]